jgi:hypothetical protein
MPHRYLLPRSGALSQPQHTTFDNIESVKRTSTKRSVCVKIARQAKQSLRYRMDETQAAPDEPLSQADLSRRCRRGVVKCGSGVNRAELVAEKRMRASHLISRS